jgi:hypothetical protein
MQHEPIRSRKRVARKVALLTVKLGSFQKLRRANSRRTDRDYYPWHLPMFYLRAWEWRWAVEVPRTWGDDSQTDRASWREACGKTPKGLHDQRSGAPRNRV